MREIAFDGKNAGCWELLQFSLHFFQEISSAPDHTDLRTTQSVLLSYRPPDSACRADDHYAFTGFGNFLVPK